MASAEDPVMHLSSIGTAIMMTTNGMVIGAERARANRARAAADDSHTAASIYGAASSAHAAVASGLRVKLMGAESEIERLQDRVDDLEAERREILLSAKSLMDELEAMRASRH